MKLIDISKVKKIEKRVNNIVDFFLYLYDVNSNLFKIIFLLGLFIWRSIQLSMLLASQGKYNNACLSKELINTSCYRNLDKKQSL